MAQSLYTSRGTQPWLGAPKLHCHQRISPRGNMTTLMEMMMSLTKTADHLSTQSRTSVSPNDVLLHAVAMTDRVLNRFPRRLSDFRFLRGTSALCSPKPTLTAIVSQMMDPVKKICEAG